MSVVKGLMARLRSAFRKKAIEEDLDEEIRHHLELETEANIRRGLPPAEAHRRARLAFGGVEVVKEDHRDGRGVRWAEELAADVRVALRTLRRSPALAGAAIVTLALGIGANTAVFSVVNAVILRGLPFQGSDRLVMLSEENPEKGWRRNVAAPANFLDWRERVKAFADVAAYTTGGPVTLSGDGAPRLLESAGVTGNFFSVLGIRPAAGRVLNDGETWSGGRSSVVISYRLWRDGFGGAANIEGRSITLDGVKRQIVGVAPAGFAFPTEKVDIWQGSGWDPADRSQVWFRRAHWLRVIARVKPEVSLEQAGAEFQTVVRQLQVEYPATNRVMGAEMTPLHEFLISDVRLPLLVLQGAVVVLLLIGCANVGNLLLVHAAGREREAAMRLALGAGQLRLLRQSVTESLVLALLGGALGLLLGVAGTKVLASMQPDLLPVREVGVDWWVLGYSLLAAVCSGLLFGTAPVLWNRRRIPAEIMKEGGRSGSEGRRARHLGDVLAVGQVALALLLAVGAGLLVKSFQRLQRVDPGFESHGVVAMRLNLPGPDYETRDQVTGFFDQLRERIAGLSGVESVALAYNPPLTTTGWTSDFSIAGWAPDQYGSELAHESVTPDYFRVLRIPVKAGRAFTPDDRRGGDMVVVVNEALAKQYFPGQDPVGRMMAFDKVPDSNSVWRRIVGVVGSVRQTSLALEPQIQVFTPMAQAPSSAATVLVRSGRGDPAGLVPALRQVVTGLDRNLAIQSVDLMDVIRDQSIARQKFLMTLLLVFASTGLVLAVVGVYGVMAQLAARRRREMGIRIALGAQSGEVQWLVVRRGLEFLVAGATIGIGAALVATRAMRGLLFEVQPGDPTTFAVVTLLLALAALAATWLPAVRASRADPVDVLRSD